MHQIKLSPHIVERAQRQRGGHLTPRPIDVTRTAHLVIDLQVGFLEVGAPVEVPVAREIVPNVNRICTAVREGGGVNVFLRYTYDPHERTPWTRWYERFCSPEVAARSRAAFRRGAREHQLWPELDVREGDWIVEKTRFSAFTPGTCSLHERLMARGIETVIITGTLTNCCSESTARDAHQLNYDVVFVADANATLSDEEHNATLNNLYPTFVDLMLADELTEKLGTPPHRSMTANALPSIAR